MCTLRCVNFPPLDIVVCFVYRAAPSLRNSYKGCLCALALRLRVCICVLRDYWGYHRSRHVRSVLRRGGDCVAGRPALRGFRIHCGPDLPGLIRGLPACSLVAITFTLSNELSFYSLIVLRAINPESQLHRSGALATTRRMGGCALSSPASACSRAHRCQCCSVSVM